MFHLPYIGFAGRLELMHSCHISEFGEEKEKLFIEAINNQSSPFVTKFLKAENKLCIKMYNI